VGAWEKDKIRGFIVVGPVECARDVLRDVTPPAGRPHTERALVVALTLEGSATSVRPPNATVLSNAAGVIPIVARSPADIPDADVRAYVTQFATRPSWWTALGRDAATLARIAIREMPLDTTTDRAAVVQRRALAQSRLDAATARLWTTDASGFAGARAIARTLRTVELPR
jgi:hypothetical protein